MVDTKLCVLWSRVSVDAVVACLHLLLGPSAWITSLLVSGCCMQECNLAGKPVYVTRVVDTMTDAPRPTRAEATGGVALQHRRPPGPARCHLECGSSSMQQLWSDCQWLRVKPATTRLFGFPHHIPARVLTGVRIVKAECACVSVCRLRCADVANLVLDGADGIVLGSETFRGKFAVGSADTVLAICRQVRGVRLTHSLLAAPCSQQPAWRLFDA